MRCPQSLGPKEDTSAPPVPALAITYDSPVHQPSLCFDFASNLPRIPERASRQNGEYGRTKSQEEEEYEFQDQADCEWGSEGSVSPFQRYGDAARS